MVDNHITLTDCPAQGKIGCVVPLLPNVIYLLVCVRGLRTEGEYHG